MRHRTGTKILLSLLQIVFLLAPAFAKSAPMSADEVNNFLVGENSWLANGYYTNNLIPEYINVPYPVPNDDGSDSKLEYVQARQAYVDTFYNKTVAQLIYEEAAQHDINPRLILTLLQRESSAITQSTPSSTTREAWSLFYMYNERMKDCLSAVYLDGRGDITKCNDADWPRPSGAPWGSSDYRQRAYDFGGIGQQIAYATAQLRSLHDNSCSNLTISVDGSNLTVNNAASCALYTYTPHAASYDTNSAFYTNWASWWSGTPNGGAYDATNIISEENFKYSASSTPPPPPPRKAGDANDDSAVDSTDLSILADQWGKNVAANTGADYNGDGVVDSTDLSILADAWGK
jgi:hypothetical protein